MTHQDQGRNGSVCSHARDLHKALRWLMAGVSLGGIVFRPDAHGRRRPWCSRPCSGRGRTKKPSWNASPPHARLSSIATASNTNPREVIRRSSSCCANGPSPCEGAFHGVSPADGPNARRRVDDRRLAGLRRRWQPRRCAAHPQERRAVFAEVEVVARGPKASPRRRSAERARQAARERKANVPRIWLTMLWHVGSGLPWDWRTGPSDSSERGHFQEMLAAAARRIVADGRCRFRGLRSVEDGVGRRPSTCWCAWAAT